MPGRHSVYDPEVETVSVPLKLAKVQADYLRSTVAPTRSAAVRAVVEARIAADAVARGGELPDDEIGLIEAEASCLRLKRQALAVGDTDAADAFEAVRVAIQAKRMHRTMAGLTTNPAPEQKTGRRKRRAP